MSPSNLLTYPPDTANTASVTTDATDNHVPPPMTGTIWRPIAIRPVSPTDTNNTASAAATENHAPPQPDTGDGAATENHVSSR